MGKTINPPRHRVDVAAMAILVVLCASWGLQQVTIKVANQGIPPLLQAGLRSVGSALLIWLWMAARGKPVFEKDGTLWWGLAAFTFLTPLFGVMAGGLLLNEPLTLILLLALGLVGTGIYLVNRPAAP